MIYLECVFSIFATLLINIRFYKNLEYHIFFLYNCQYIGKDVIVIANSTQKIKILMIKHGITQTELATKLGISQPALSKKFKQNDWRESDLEKIALVCDAHFDTIFKYNDEII